MRFCILRRSARSEILVQSSSMLAEELKALLVPTYCLAGWGAWAKAFCTSWSVPVSGLIFARSALADWQYSQVCPAGLLCPAACSPVAQSRSFVSGLMLNDSRDKQKTSDEICAPYAQPPRCRLAGCLAFKVQLSSQ
ncbi:hypothetical protein CC79DRAFT_819519 [Sarocladium strictum]